ncbi:hypothetical protein BC829DRAFT_443531 [Chytridium lagenaria]|nr:hypothetical protein BC829DRAFT_443531 [Chytridium lagenaria]
MALGSKYPIDEKHLPSVKISKSLAPSCPGAFFLQLSKTWDRGSRSVRERILQEFVNSNRNKTGPQLEREFGNGASLFLTRSRNILQRYLLGYNTSLQLQAISIFVSAASGHRFLAEFLEVGGVLTVLELLGLSQIKEADKAEALRLLLHVANAGRKYKEFLCESYGVRAVADCLARSRSEVTQDYCRNLLYQLGLGNPKFLMQVYKSLLSLLTSTSPSPTSQQMAGQALRMLLPSIQSIHASVVDATISLLKSPHIQIQYEGFEILKELVYRPSLQDTILTQVISILKIPVEDMTEDMSDDRRRRGGKGGNDGKTLTANQWGGMLKSDEKVTDAMLATFIQQAYASKFLGIVAAASDEIAEKMIQLQIISGLLNVVANYLVHHFDHVADALQSHMGRNFFDLLEFKPDTFFRELTWEQVRYLRKNTVKINAANDEEAQKTEDESESGSSDEDRDSRTSRAANGPKKSRVSVTAFPATKWTDAPESAESASAAIPTKEDEATKDKTQQEIMNEYEKMTDPNDREMVKELYRPYGHTAANTTFSNNKFKTSLQGDGTDRFEHELDNFRASNNKRRAKDKKEFQVQFDGALSSKIESIRTDVSLFTKERPVPTIEANARVVPASITVNSSSVEALGKSDSVQEVDFGKPAVTNFKLEA